MSKFRERVQKHGVSGSLLGLAVSGESVSRFAGLDIEEEWKIGCEAVMGTETTVPFVLH